MGNMVVGKAMDNKAADNMEAAGNKDTQYTAVDMMARKVEPQDKEEGSKDIQVLVNKLVYIAHTADRNMANNTD